MKYLCKFHSFPRSKCNIFSCNANSQSWHSHSCRYSNSCSARLRPFFIHFTSLVHSHNCTGPYKQSCKNDTKSKYDPVGPAIAWFVSVLEKHVCIISYPLTALPCTAEPGPAQPPTISVYSGDKLVFPTVSRSWRMKAQVMAVGSLRSIILTVRTFKARMIWAPSGSWWTSGSSRIEMITCVIGTGRLWTLN